MNTIIFSKDRAMQLDALLQSMKQFAPHLLPANVLLLATSCKHMGAYQQLMSEHSEQFYTFQTDFRSNLLNMVSYHQELTTFLVDDDVFFLPAREVVALPPRTCFSYRLGVNITADFNSGSVPQRVGTGVFLYAYSLDGHVFQTDDIRPLLLQLPFRNPNELEAILVQRGPGLKVIYDVHSCVVGIPHNLVQTAWTNRNMGGSAEDLLTRYLDGERINLKMMDFGGVNSTHQDISFAFQRTGKVCR